MIRVVRLGFVALTLLDALLVGLGLLLIPGGLSLPGLAGVLLILAVYALVGWFAAPPVERRSPGTLPLALRFGLAAGAVFAAEILLEYILLPDSAGNARMGLVEYGTVLILFFVAAFWGARTSGSTRAGLLAAVWAALVASLVWYGLVLLVFYAYHGTPAQAQVMLAEGNLEDFQRSGMRNFDAFIYQDFLGAGFFHSILVPAAAGIVGLAGGLLGRVTRSLGREKPWGTIES